MAITKKAGATTRTRTKAPAAAKGKPMTRAAAGGHKPAKAPKPMKPPAKALKGPASKTWIYWAIAKETGLTRFDIARVFVAANAIITRELGPKGPGVFVWPGLLKLKVHRKPAVKARQGVNPFTKEPMALKAKPAHNVVKAIPMKALKTIYP
jgi:nucleoid DNA-binding protein